MSCVKKQIVRADSVEGEIETEVCLNLVKAIFERLQNDLTQEVILDSLPWRRSKGAEYMRLCRAKAYRFFFDETSGLHKGFLQWCELAGFDNLFWRKKAIVAVALKIIRSPHFRTRVVAKLCDAATLAEIDDMVEKIVCVNKRAA